MTDQSPNDLFHASSFMQGHNAEDLEQVSARYASETKAANGRWKGLFGQSGDGA